MEDGRNEHADARALTLEEGTSVLSRSTEEVEVLRRSGSESDPSHLDQRDVRKRNVLIFRQILLPISETFVQAQASGLREFRTQYIGLKPATLSLSLPSDAILLVRTRSLSSRFRTILYNWTGVASSFHRRAQLAKPVLIHAHFAPDGAAALALASYIDVPLLVSLHGYDVTMRDEYRRKTMAGKLYLQRRSRLWDRATLFLCASDFIRQKAIEAGFPSRKLRLHYIGVDRRRFSPSEIQGPRKNCVMFVGRLVPNKGCDYLLRAMQLVQKKDPSAKLVIIGDGYLRSSLRALATDLGVSCEFLGSQPSSVVHGWLGQSNILCAPSVTATNGESEGLGMAILEAQALGTPVVGFQTGGIPEAVLHRETGLLAPERDYEQLAEHILRYREDEAFWRESSSLGVQWIAKRFDLETQNRQLERIYEECQARE